MKTAIIVHGMPSKEEYYNPQLPSSSNFQWLPWIQKQLVVNEIIAQTPEMPYAFAPDYKIWATELERFDITPETILVGHSCGGGFLVRWLSENPNVRVGKVVLVAPWIDPDREETTNFFDFEIDPHLSERTQSLTIFHSDDDMESVQKSVQILRNTLLGHKFKQFHNYGHFCTADMKTNEFPELLMALL